VLFLLVIGGIYFGWFSPTAGAGIGAIGAFLFALARRKLGWRKFKESLLSATTTSAMIFFIILGAMLMSYFLAVTQLPVALSNLVNGLDISPYLIWFFVVILYLFLGCLMDEIGMLLLTVRFCTP